MTNLESWATIESRLQCDKVKVIFSLEKGVRGIFHEKRTILELCLFFQANR